MTSPVAGDAASGAAGGSMFGPWGTLIGAAVGAGVGAFGAMTSANASSAMYNYKAGIAQMNQQIAQQNAAWATNAGGIKASEEGLKDAQEIAQTKTNQAASGIDVTTGSHAAVTTDQTDVAKYNQGIIRADAAHTAYGYETQAAGDTAEARLDTASATNAQTAGWIGVASSIIGGVSSVSSKWSQGNSIGMFSNTSPGPIGTFSNGGNDGAAPSWSS